MNHQIKRKKLEVKIAGSIISTLRLEVNHKYVSVVDGNKFMPEGEYLMPYPDFKKMVRRRAVNGKY